MSGKWILSALLCMLLLCGCAPEPEADPVQTVPNGGTKPAAEQTAPKQELYLPGSAIEEQTKGAVREYRLEGGEFCGVARMGEKLLLTTCQECATLTLLSGENLAVEAQTELDCALSPGEGNVREDGVGFYDSTRRAVVFLNEALQESTAVSLPGTMQGQPELSPDWQRVYYCTDRGLQVLERQTGISWQLKEFSDGTYGLQGMQFDGQAVYLCHALSDGEAVGEVISTKDGQTVWQLAGAPALSTAGNRYCLTQQEGSVTLLRYGAGEEPDQCLNVPQDSQAAYALPELPGWLVVTTADTGSVLRLYDLEHGWKTAEVTLPGVKTVWAPCWDAGTGRIFFAGSGGGSQVFYSWDPAKSQTGDRTVYAGLFYTRENPDRAGLAALGEQAAALGARYDVDIRIWEDAAAAMPEEVAFLSEYQTAAYQQGLAMLESALKRFPEGFFTAGGMDTLHICLVRSIQPDAAQGREAGGMQFWQDGAPYLALALGDDLEGEFYHALSFVMDNRVLVTSTVYDDWERLNPGDFTYDYDYAANETRTDSELTEGENRAFVDVRSMSFPKEDRAAIFEYAMQPMGAEVFATDTMQKKLRTVCLGIREAFDLENAAQPLPWEQYLEEPIIP